MRSPSRLAAVALCAAFFFNAHAAEDTAADEQMLRTIYTAALTTSPAAMASLVYLVDKDGL